MSIHRSRKNYTDNLPDNYILVKFLKQAGIKDWFTYRESYEILYPSSYRIFLN